MKHVVSLIFAFCILPQMLCSQVAQRKVLKGNIEEQESKYTVAFGALKNMSTGNVALTDEFGQFSISGTVGDTLKFHSLGYADTTWVIPTVWYAGNEGVTLKVNTNVYPLNEVEVVRFYSYAHFKQAFKDLKLPEDENQRVKEMVHGWDFSEAIALGIAEKKFNEGTFGMSVSVGGKSRLEQQREEVERLENIANNSDEYNYFTSRENISELTGYNGTCLDSFMVFLNTNYKLDYQMNNYDLLASILGAHNDFKKLKSDKDWYVEADTIPVQ